MKHIRFKTFLVLIVLSMFSSDLCAQPKLHWQKPLGGSKNDWANSITSTRDGGYIIAGMTHSRDGDLTEHYGDSAQTDAWIIKLSNTGVVEWQRSYGGSGDDAAGTILQTSDGGYIFSGYTSSHDGDVHGLHDSTHYDLWVVKIDSIGAIIWQKTYGGSDDDYGSAMIQGGEGGYVIAGVTHSSDGDVKGFHGGTAPDCWVINISEKGNLLWQKTFGGTKDDEATSIVATRDGGYAFTGFTFSIDGDITSKHGDNSTPDIWLVKLSGAGSLEWQRTYGGSNYDEGISLLQTLDHGYAICGITYSIDGDVHATHNTGFSDCLVLKLDSIGSIVWGKNFGGSNGDGASSLIQLPDSGLVVAGYATSNDGDVTGLHGDPVISTDAWIFRLRSNGSLLWQTVLGGSGHDEASQILATPDMGYIIAGFTWSDNGDVLGSRSNASNSDAWVVKLATDNSGIRVSGEQMILSFSIFPNPTLGKSKISYALQKVDDAEIVLYNTLGVELRRIHHRKMNTGKHEDALDLSGLPTGSYVLRLTAEGNQVSEVIEVMR